MHSHPVDGVALRAPPPYAHALRGAATPGAGLPLRGRAPALAPRIGNEPFFLGPSALPLAGHWRPGRAPPAPRRALAAAPPGAERAPPGPAASAPQRGGTSRASLLEKASAVLKEFPLTPVGIIEALFSPPFLYVLIGLVLLCCSGSLIYVFRDGMEPYMMAFVDVLASIGRSFLTCLQGLYWCLQRLVFPLKELFMDSARSTDHYFNPYKKKEPARQNVPTFQI